MSSQMWTPLLGEFVDQYDVIVVDARGRGASGWDGAQFSVEDLARDVLCVFDQLQLDSAYLLGLSMGGSTALTFAGMVPERVARLVLCDTTAWYGANARDAWAQRGCERRERSPTGSDSGFSSSVGLRVPSGTTTRPHLRSCGHLRTD